MAQWTGERVDSANINNGQEYSINDNVSLEELNAIVNTALYASDISDTANSKADSAIATANTALSQVVEKQGTIVTVGGVAQSTFEADTKLNKNQGTNNANKVVVTDEQGEIKPSGIDFIATENGVDIQGNVTLNGSELQPKLTAGDGIEIEGSVIKIVGSGAGLHNSIYRGVNLKTHWGLTTEAQVVSKVTTNISNGTFEDLFIGDYFDITINSDVGGSEVVTCVIAGFDIYLNCGDTALTQHHAVIVPKDCFKTPSQMNSSNTTSGGYAGSALYTDILPKYATALQTAFSDHIIKCRELLSNQVNTSAKSGAYYAWDGASSHWDWYDSLIELMSEPEVFGGRILSSSYYDVGIAKAQLPLFALNPAMIQANSGNSTTRQLYWLKAVVASPNFCVVSFDSNATYTHASDSCGVRPRFLIG